MKLSIITVNYNNKQGLEKTINSVINQSFTDFEYVIIDGKSTAGDQEIIKKYESKITYWISESDLGIYNAMNKGIKAATGEFVLFMNSGDCFFDNDVLKKTIPFLASSVGFYYGNLIFSIKEQQKISTPPSTLSFSYFIDFSLPHQATFIKKDLFYQHFFYNEQLKIMSDWEFTIYCICKENVPYQHLNFPIAYFDSTGVSSNPNNSTVFAKEKEVVLQKHFPLFFDDSKDLHLINSKRFEQIKKIKNKSFSWKFLKAIINLLLIFQPKTQTNFARYYPNYK